MLSVFDCYVTTQHDHCIFYSTRFTELLTGHWHVSHQNHHNMILPSYNAVAICDMLTFITCTNRKVSSQEIAF